MNFGFSEEQEFLRAEVRKFLDQNAPIEAVRQVVETQEGFDRHLWNRMAELGWVGLAMPQAHGGMGLGLVTLLVVLEETGRSLFPSPLISTVIAAKAIERFGSVEQQARWLPGLADGSRLGTFALLEQSDDLAPEGIELVAELVAKSVAKPDGDELLLSGSKLYVPDASVADLIVVAVRSGEAAEDVSLVVVESDAAGLVASDFPAMDLSKRLGKVELSDVRVSVDSLLGPAGEAWPAIRWLIDLGAALVTAETVGAAEQANQIAVDFAKERVQFGSPIGRFQGVKHPLAEMYVDIESYKSLIYYAFWALDEDDASAALAISRAKAYASETFPEAGINGVQLHGGVGYTWEYDIQLYLKRGKWMRPMFGDANYHYERIASLGGL